MKISCVILNYNDAEHVVQLVDRIRDYAALHSIVVVDNQSRDDSRSVLQKLRSEHVAVVASDRNGGYGYGNNFGARYAFGTLGADAVLIANPDVIFEEKLVTELGNTLEQADSAGVVSAIQLDRNGREVEHSAWTVPTVGQYILSLGALSSRLADSFYIPLSVLHQRTLTEVGCVAGSLLMVSREAFQATGGYDEEMFLYCEETTLGIKMQQHGFRSYLRSDLSYIHAHGVSISKSIKSKISQRKILLKSHQLVLKRYLQASGPALAADRVLGAASILEERLKTGLRRG